MSQREPYLDSDPFFRRAPTAPAHLRAAHPILLVVLLVTGILGIGAIAAGIVAIVWNAQSPTQLQLLGIAMTTGHAGVALVGIGLFSLVVVFRRALRSVDYLAALPPVGRRKP